MACVELYGDVHPAQSQTPTQLPIGFYGYFIGVISVSVSLSVSGSVNTPQRIQCKFGQDSLQPDQVMQCLFIPLEDAIPT